MITAAYLVISLYYHRSSGMVVVDMGARIYDERGPIMLAHVHMRTITAKARR